MADFDWKSLLGGVAPFLATAIGIPGPLATLAINAAGAALGVADPTPEKVAAAVQAASPADLLALKQADIEFEKLKADVEKAYLADRQDARARDVAVNVSKDAPYISKTITHYLALFIIGAAFTLFAIVLFYEGPIDASRKDLMIYILGALSTLSAQVCAYYYGASRDTAASQQNMARAMNGKPK